MERKLVAFVATLSLLAVALAVFLPGGRSPEEFPKLPWKIHLDPEGNSRVFGVTLGRSTLAEAQEAFDAEAKINLFATPDRQYAVEAYFDRLYLSGIKADLVLTLELSQREADEIYQRGLRVSKLSSGSRKVDVAPEDRLALLQRPIGHITYLPAADLEPDLIDNLFGEPARRIPGKAGITHWLYPKQGLDIAMNHDGKEVFQYVPPARFAQLTAPLGNTSADRNQDFSPAGLEE